MPGVVAGLTTPTETVYLRAAGDRALDTRVPMTVDTTFGIFSTTKAVTATVALMLVDDGQLDLDAPASTYLPELADLTVLEGFDADGKQQTRPARSVPTTRQLLTHSSGFAYAFYSDKILRLRNEFDVPDIATCRRASIETPLVFDPGTDWMYGTGLDWVGQIVEVISGLRLGEVMNRRLFEPLGMSHTAFGILDAAADNVATLHHRRDDGTLKANHRFAPPADPEIHMGGHGLFSTVDDYLRFLRLWLNDGKGPDGSPLLSPTLVADATSDQLAGLPLRGLTSTQPPISNDVKFLPRQTWSLPFALDVADAPTGRSAGSLSWAGLANLYFWIDPINRVAGYWASQLFPFADRVAFGHYQAFESAVYEALSE